MVSFQNTGILVTGGTGFIGGRLVERLALEEKACVRVLVHNWHKATWVSRTTATLLGGDVNDFESLTAAMAGCQVVFHCVGVGGSREDCWRVNVDGTKNVLEAARVVGVQRVVYLSSIAVHGPAPPDNANENAPFVRTGASYGDSKIAAEEVLWEFAKSSTVEITVLRPTFVWGPCSCWFTVAPVQEMKAGKFCLIEQGKGTCHAVHVDNLVDAMLLAAQKPEAIGEAFIITDQQPCTWAEFFHEYAAMLGIARLPSVPLKHIRLAKRIDRVLGGLYSNLSWRPTIEPLRTLMRASRFSLRLVRRPLTPFVEFSDWDVAKFLRRGDLDTSKSRDRLGYRARLSRKEGMRDVEIWLRDQNII